MRAIWTGSLSFGLINIPVRLFSGAESKQGISFRQLSKKDLSPIQYLRVSRETGEEVPYEDIVKGYEYRKGDYIVLSDEVFEEAEKGKRSTIDIKQFADQDEIDVRLFKKPYYLEPQKGANRSYALLNEALKLSGEVAVATFVLRNREHLATILPAGKLLILNELRFASEVRDVKELKLPDEEPEKQEVDMALALIKQLSRPFDKESYKDSYTTKLQKAIEAKLEGKDFKEGEQPQRPATRDIMASLKASLEMAQS